MKKFEIEVKTAIKNTDDASGNWFYYYKAETAEDAVKSLMEETKANHVKVNKVVSVKAVG